MDTQQYKDRIQNYLLYYRGAKYRHQKLMLECIMEMIERQDSPWLNKPNTFILKNLSRKDTFAVIDFIFSFHT